MVARKKVIILLLFFFFPIFSLLSFMYAFPCTCSLPCITVTFDSLPPSIRRCPWFWARRDMSERAAEAKEAEGVGRRIDWTGGRGG